MPLAVLKKSMRPLVEAGGPLASTPEPDEGGDDRTVLGEVGGGGPLAPTPLPDESEVLSYIFSFFL